MYYLVVADINERGCECFKFANKKELLIKVNSLSTDEHVELIVEGKEINLIPIEIVKKWDIQY